MSDELRAVMSRLHSDREMLITENIAFAAHIEVLKEELAAVTAERDALLAAARDHQASGDQVDAAMQRLRENNPVPSVVRPAASAHIVHRVSDRCPACNSESLYAGIGGHITCSVLGCPDPLAAGRGPRLGEVS